MGSKISISRRTIPEILPLYQSFPGYIDLLLASVTKDFRLIRDYQFLPIDKWSPTLRGLPCLSSWLDGYEVYN